VGSAFAFGKPRGRASALQPGAFQREVRPITGDEVDDFDAEYRRLRAGGGQSSPGSRPTSGPVWIAIFAET